jgi:hypothetical protein
MRNACKVLVSKLKVRNHKEEVGISRRIILKGIIRKHCVGADRFDLPHGGVRWQNLVNAVINFLDK